MFEDQNTPPNLPVGDFSSSPPKPAIEPAPSPQPSPKGRGGLQEAGGGEPEDIFDKVEPASPSTGQPFGLAAPADSAGRPASHSIGQPFGLAAPADSAGRPAPAPGLRPARAGGPPSPPGRGEGEGGAVVKEPLVSSRKVIVVVGIVLGVAVLAVVAWGLVRFARRAATPTPQIELPAFTPEAFPTIPTLPQPLPPAETETLPGAQLPPVEDTLAPEAEPTQPVDSDSDGDGLTDTEEENLGTQPTNPDSDNDGLFDGEEVNTYGTDPLSPDTDGDGFLDGQEVRNGFNPKGEGRLFTVPSQ